MTYTYSELRQALSIIDNTVKIAKRSTPKIPDIDAVLDSCYEGQAVVLSEAVLESDDAPAETLVIRGKSAFLDHISPLPVVATFKLRAGKVQMSLEYTLPTPGWRFSHSFRDLPKTVDWRKTFADSMSIPLDDLMFSKACFIVINDPPPLGEYRGDLQQGINFLGTMQVLGGAQSSGVADVMKRAFNYSANELTVTGTIGLQEFQMTALSAGQHPWREGEDPIPPGILLKADLGLALPLNRLPESPLNFDQVNFRIYSPISTRWLANNETFAPVFAYTGTLSVPNANLPVALQVTAIQELGADELLLTGQFADASIANLAKLGGASGTRYNLLDSMGPFKSSVEALVQLELMSAVMAISVKEEGGIEVASASVTVGLPRLNWQLFDANFVLQSCAAQFDVPSPFLTKRQVNPVYPSRKDEIDVTLLGKFKIFQHSFDFTATTRDAFTVNAQLAAGETIELTDLIKIYPAGSVNPLGDNLTFDYLALSATPNHSTYTFAGRLKSEPKLEITTGFALSEVNLRLEKRDVDVLGEIGAVFNIGGVDLALSAAKEQDGWLFKGETRPNQTIDFYQLVRDKNVVPGLDIPQHSNFPASLQIVKGKVEMLSSTGKVDFTGDAKFHGDTFWTFSAFGATWFKIEALRGEIHLSGSDEDLVRSAMLAGDFVFGDNVVNLVGAASVKLGSANVDTIVEVALKKVEAGDASKFKVDRIADQLSGGRLPFKQLVPDRLLDRISTLSQLAISINLTKSIYLASGMFEGASAYFLYQGAVSPATRDGYVFAAGLGNNFKFENLSSELKQIDEVVTVKEAMLAIYAAPDQGLEKMKQTVVEFQTGNWPLPDKTELALERGLLVKATIQPGTSKLFDKLFQIGDVVGKSELCLMAQVEVDPGTNDVLATSFGVNVREIRILDDAIRLSELRVAFTTRQSERELRLDGTLMVKRVFANDYAFRGQLTLNSSAMAGKLDLVSNSPASEVKEPFGLPGIEIKRLSIEVDTRFAEPATSKFALCGETLLGRPPVAGKSYSQVHVITRLGLAQGKPVLMSMVLKEPLDLGSLLLQCFTGAGSKWPEHFIDLRFEAGSAVYYYDKGNDEARIWLNQPALGEPLAIEYKDGFNIDARVKLILVDPIPLRFTLKCLLDQGNKPVGIEAHVAVGLQPVDLLFVQLAGKELKGEAYIGAPTLDLVTHPRTSFGFSTGVNFFGKGFFSAQVGISRTPEGNTQVAGRVAAAEALPVFGLLAFDFTYTRKQDRNEFAISNWPGFEIAVDVVKLFNEIKKIADALKITGCASLADFVVNDQIQTRCLISPSAKAIDDHTLEFSLRVSYSVIGIITLDFDDLTIPVRLAKDTTFSQLPVKFTEEIITRAIPKLAEDLLGSPKNVTLFLALTFGKEGVRIALVLVCRGLVNALVPLAVEAAIAALSIAGATLLAVMAAILVALAGMSTRKPGDTAPRKPLMRKLAFDGKKFSGEWNAADYVDNYELEVSGPPSFVTQRVGSLRALKATLSEQSTPLVAGHYAGRVQGVRGNEKSGWSEKLSIEQLAAPPVQLAYAADKAIDYLKSAWTGLSVTGLTYDLRLLLDQNPLPGQDRRPMTEGTERWELAGLAPGAYTTQLVVRGDVDKYIASNGSVSNPVVKLAPPVVVKLTYADDRLSVSWTWTGDAAATEFALRLVADGIDGTQDLGLENPSATAARFVVPNNLAVARYQVRTKAHPKAALSAHTAPSDWSLPSTYAIAKLPPPVIKSVHEVAVIEPFTAVVGVDVAHAIAGADVNYARLVYTGASSQVEFPSDGIGNLSLPDVYHGLAKVEVRAAKRDGAAIASDWVKRDIVRLAAPADVAFTYPHRQEGITSFTFAPAPSTTDLHYEVKLFLMSTRPTLLEQRIVPAAGAGPTEIPVGDVPAAGRIRAGVRAVATDQTVLPSAWAIAPQVLTKRVKATVTAWFYDERSNSVRVQLQKAEEAGGIYEVDLVESDRGPWRGPNTDIEIPNPFAPGQTGSYTVTARLCSTDPTVIDGDWQVSTFKLTKYPQPTKPELVWDDATGQIAVSFTAGVATQRHEVQLVADNEPFGNVLPIEPNAFVKKIPLDENMPAGQIGVRVRSSGTTTQAIPGDWVRSAATLQRPQAYSGQPRLLYLVGAESITAEWPGSATRVRLAVQLLDGQSMPVGTTLTVDSPAVLTPIYAELNFGDDLPPGEVRVRFRTIPLSVSTLPGLWTTSTQALNRLSPASSRSSHQYVDGSLIVTLIPLHNTGPRPSAFGLSFDGADTSTRTYGARREPLLEGRDDVVITVPPDDFPAGKHKVKIWTIGENDHTIDGAASYIQYPLAPICRPTITQIGYASGRLTLAWSNTEWAFVPYGNVSHSNVKIDAGDGKVAISSVEPSVNVSVPQNFVLYVDQLEGLPDGVVWRVSVQALGEYGSNYGGSGPWSEPASVLVLDPPTGLDIRAEAGNLSGRWTPSPGMAPRTYELELTSAALPQPLLWIDLDTASVDDDTSSLPAGAYSVRVRASVEGSKSAWSLAVIVQINRIDVPVTRNDVPSGLVLKLEHNLNGWKSLWLVAQWADPPGEAPQSYELELDALVLWHKPYYAIPSIYESNFIRGALPQPLILTGMDTRSVRHDISTLNDGLYTARVRVMVSECKTAWSESASFVISEAVGTDMKFVAQLIRTAEMPAPRAVQVLKQQFPSISQTNIRYELTKMGYPLAEVDSVFASWVTKYRKTETSQRQIVGATHLALPELAFDDAMKRLSLSLSEINVYRQKVASFSGENWYICGIQAVYGYGSERISLPVHGVVSPWSEGIHIGPNSRITRISGDATTLFDAEGVHPVRLNSLCFFFDGSDSPIKEIGRSSNEYPFSFEAKPGEEVCAFFGATYADGSIPYTGPILASLGVWMKYNG